MRKLVLLCAAICCLTTIASAQIEKGRIQLQGLALYNNSDVGGTTFDQLNISTQTGFFLSDNISLGPVIGYNRRKTSATNQNDQINSEFQFGAFARFHKNVADNFYLFLQPSFQVGLGMIDMGGVDQDLNSFNFDISPGALYFLSDRFAMELNLSFFNYRNQEVQTVNGGTIDANSTNVGLNLNNVGIGLSYFLK